MAAPRELDLSDEVEGEQDGTTDFVFRLVGDPIPVLPTASSPLPLFDLHSPPARPLAVSNRHAAVFLAHPKGFSAARTKALIDASKEAREKGKASTRFAQDCCVADVPLPGVSLLALSRDESVLAACTRSEIKFFSVTSLLSDKDVEPSSSCSLGQSGTMKDFKWLNHGYIVLSNGGLLSHGSLGEGLKDVMENIDAVDCCKDGNHIAVVRENSLRILSSDLKETCCMVLLFQLWSESDSEGTDIKVDSIGWVRDDSIVVGCVRLDEVGSEVGYMVQVIRSGGDTFFESSSKPVVFSYDIFGGIMDDILPSGVGPNLLLGYLHRWDLMVFSNKKSTDDHISLLKWPSITDDERTVVYLEMLEDKYSPRIDLQENGDDNVILGFGVENVSLFQKITVLVGPEQKEVAPQHLLLCLTSEGKLIIYYLARISDPSDLPQTSLSTIEDSNVNKQISHATVSGKDLSPSVTSSMAKSLLAEPGAEPSGAQAEIDQHGSRDAKSISSVSGNKDVAGSLLPISSDNKSLNTKQVNVASPFAPPSSSAPSPFAPRSSSASSPLAPPSSSAPTSNMKLGMPFSFSTANNAGLNSTGSKGSSQLVSSWQPSNSSSFVNSQFGKGGLDSAKPLGAFGGSQSSPKGGGGLSFKSSLFSSDGSVPVKTVERNEATGFGSYSAQTSSTAERKVPGSSTGLSSAPSLPISPNNSVGSSSAGFGAGNLEVLSTPRGSPLPQQTIGTSYKTRTHTSTDSRNFKLGTKFDTEQDLSKKFYSINDMTEELDTLLAHIEKDGGFRDASITLQQHPLSVLEGDLQNLLELLQVFKNKIEEQCSKADNLRNKMFQVSARQAYMKGILSQSSDTQYWDIWNRQKLSPEFEAKRQNILKANQNLTNQLVELERHFNNLEMNKFGETGRVTSSRRAVYSNKSRSSQTQLSSVYNALNSQLAAAEQLSECLSKQICALNISSSKKRGAVTKELFESIGLAHTADVANFSGGTPSKLNQRFPSTKEHTKGMLGPSKSAEPETARRRRESLDRSLASLEPQKTTVKRIAQQQRLKISSDLPFRSNKKMFDSQMAAISQETFSGSPSSSLVESYTSRLRSPTEVLDEKTKQSGPQHNSLFKWVKEPAGPSHGSEQKHVELPGRMKSAEQSSKLVPSSPTSFSYTQRDTRDRVSSPSAASFGTTHTVPKSNTLTFKTTITPKTNAITRPDMSPAETSSLPVKTFSGESAAGSILTTKNRHSDQDVPSFGSMKGLGISSQNMGGNKPSLSSEPSKPVVLHGKTFQLNGVSDTMQNSAKASPQVAPQPHAFSPASQSSSFSIMSGASSLAASPLSTMQVSAAKTSDVSSSVSSIPPPQKSMSKTSPTVPDGNVSSSIPSIPTPLKESSPVLNRNVSKSEVVASEVSGATVSVSATSAGVSTTESKTALLPVTSSSLPSNPPSVPKIVPAPTESAVITSTRKDLGPSNLSSDEDEMEEESPSAGADLNLGALGGFGLGSATSSSPKKSNPFGSTFATSDSKSSGSPFTLTTSPGQLFRPASLSIPSSQLAQPTQSTSSSTFSSAFSSGLSGFGQPALVGAGQQSGFGQSAQIGAGQQAGFGQPAQIQSGFGQPAQIGSAQQSGFGQPAQVGGGQQSGFGQPAQFGAQQALGSVLGSFGQSRQLGGFGGFASSSSSGAFTSAPSSNSGFAGAAAGGGFSAAASVGGGFAAAATGGGFASLASKSGGFGAAATSAGGFGGTAQGGGFGGAAQGGGFGGGGFGAFGSNNQGAAGFSAFGGSSAASGPGGPPADFLTQMRK